MRVSIKLFARIRELIGAKSLERELPDNATVADLLARLQEEFPQVEAASSRLVVAVNRQFVDFDTPLSDGDEVAFFPPVSGGSGAADKFAITFDPISLEEVAAKVRKPETGAVVLFNGVVRNISGGKQVEYLEYEAYESMAVPKLRQIAEEAHERWPHIIDMAIVQRIGHLDVGESAVIIAVSSLHRGDGCFEACAYAIKRLKQIAPIWKKEVSPDGEEWIEGDHMPEAD